MPPPRTSIPPSDDEQAARKSPKSNLGPGTTAAGVRALSTQLIAFYFRAPVKAFFRMRVDYMQVARAINPSVLANRRWSLKISTPGLLAHAVKHHGWGFIPNQVLPPLIANVSVGAILYTSYLTALSAFYEPASHSTKRVYPPPPYTHTLAAGMVAGGVQSLVAAPLDALYTRFDVNEMLEGRHNTMFKYAKYKLREIGLRGVFAGYGFSFAKETLGYGVFFSTFEYVKQQLYLSYLTHYYGRARILDAISFAQPPCPTNPENRIVIRPHYALEPAFLFLAGITASMAQAAVSFPIAHIQSVHYSRLESLDYKSKIEPPNIKPGPSTILSRWRRLREVYAHSYGETIEQCRMQAKRGGGWRGWLYKGFVWQAVRQVPSTSAGLIMFELARRRFGEGREVRIEYEEYDIHLS